MSSVLPPRTHARHRYGEWPNGCCFAFVEGPHSVGQGVDEVANVLVAQLLQILANEDPGKDITLYINSPGGSVSAGMAIYDTMQYVPCDDSGLF
jgi:hypothetical protein